MGEEKKRLNDRDYIKELKKVKQYNYPAWSEPLPRIVNGVEAWMTQKEADKLKELSKNKSYCEIGTWKGYSAWEVSKVATHVITMDIKTNDKLIEFISKFPNIDFYHGDCHDLQNHFKDRSFDVILIDGYHYFENVKKDFEDYFPKLKMGGIICLHDYQIREGVNIFIKLLRKRTDLIEEQGICDSLIWFKKIGGK